MITHFDKTYQNPMSGRLSLKYRIACGRPAGKISTVVEKVDCKNCKRTRAFKRAQREREQELAEERRGHG